MPLQRLLLQDGCQRINLLRFCRLHLCQQSALHGIVWEAKDQQNQPILDDWPIGLTFLPFLHQIVFYDLMKAGQVGYGGFISANFANQLSCLFLEWHITSYCICVLLTLCLAALKNGKDRSRASTMLNRYRPPSAHQQELQMSCIGQAAQKQSDPSAPGSA